MRILLDECVNPRVREAFPGHTVETVRSMGWGGTTNGKLMALAQRSFEVFITVDLNLEHQQNLSTMTLGLVIVDVPDNKITFFQPIFPALLKAVENVRPGEVVHLRG